MEITGGIQQGYNEIESKYEELSSLYEGQLQQISKKIIKSGWIRVLIFLSLFAAPIYIYDYSPIAAALLFIGFAVCFGVLVKRFILLKKHKAELQSLIQLNKNELKALHRDWSVFESGEEFINPQHDFAHDLDLYGPGSFFQFINRSSTLAGTECLKQKISDPLLEQEDILSEQESIKEISTRLDFRQNFYAKGNMLNETKEDLDKLNGFKNYTPFIEGKGKAFKILTAILPWVFFISIGLTFVGLPASVPTMLFFLNLSFIGSNLKSLNRINHQFSSLTGILQKYAILTDLISKEKFSSEKLNQLQKNLLSDKTKASAVIQQLSKYMGQFDQRNGMLAGVILNGIMLWDFKWVAKIEGWLKSNTKNMEVWLDVVHEIDALNSMAGYAYNHPDFTYPTPHSSTVLQSTQLGHPLLDRNERICNDYDFKDSIFSLITGANMSGKSTFLRSVGLNYIVARSGMPVCAKEMVFKPMPLISNMRTTDSLMKHESYFYAELKRLKYIIDQLKEGKDVFIILDEILKGTNSKDKTYGSMELIKHLLSLNAYGMIATHDLELGVLEEETKGKITNLCFEVENRNNQLIFDYKLHDGVTQNHNATYLMKKMGIIISN
ncbi:MutS-related protein [Labilibacter marinus]|uniref:MutS-related protein n=1 Tax=Labilibacter marinus TaxID=1477105 RepID=UPI0009501FB4|nr:hypothetical protein [Labilibacter marinus]